MNRLFVAFAVCFAFSACTYDPPPSAELALPEGGLYTLGDPLLISFSEPVKAESVAVRVWPAGDGDRTIENELAPGLEPALDRCVAQSFSATPTANCGDNLFKLAENRMSAELRLLDAEFGKARVPWELEILSGLSDGSSSTGADHRHAFQFAPSEDASGDVIPFQPGLYLFHGPITDPLPTQITMYVDLVSQPDGKIAWTAGKAGTTDGAAKNTKDFEELFVDDTDRGFCIHTVGQLTEANGDRFIVTTPIDVKLNISGVGIILTDVKMNGSVGKDDTGKDIIDGTLSYSGVTIQAGDAEPFTYPEGNATFSMWQVPEQYLTDDAPRTCGSLQGAVTVQCDPPADFPPEPFCAVEDETPTE
ncbi:MAG: hypothetical protein ACI9OJ_002812 [Myxococcota bacterium]|jgi:hypothetical protein